MQLCLYERTVMLAWQATFCFSVSSPPGGKGKKRTGERDAQVRHMHARIRWCASPDEFYYDVMEKGIMASCDLVAKIVNSDPQVRAGAGEGYF